MCLHACVCLCRLLAWWSTCLNRAFCGKLWDVSRQNLSFLALGVFSFSKLNVILEDWLMIDAFKTTVTCFVSIPDAGAGAEGDRGRPAG